MLLSPDEKVLYVALSNIDQVAVVSTTAGEPRRYLSTSPSSQKFGGSYPTALAQSSDGKQLFVADSSLDAVAVFDGSDLTTGRTGTTSRVRSGSSLPTGTPVRSQCMETIFLSRRQKAKARARTKEWERRLTR